MQKISIRPGVLVLAGNRRLEIVAPVSSSKIEARDVISGEKIFISPGEIEFELKMSPPSDSETFKAEAEIAIRDSDLKVATDRFNVLAPLKTKQFLSKQDVEQCSARLGLSASQVRRLFSQLEMKKGPESLIPKRRGRTKGAKIIGAEVEDIIQQVIDEYYAGPGATVERVIQKVTEQCLALSLKAPSAATIANRVRERKPRELLAKKSGAKAARQAYAVRGGKVQPEAPLQLIQIDHALVDCIVVDDQRMPLMRPWITIAIDVYTRGVLGFYLSLSYPSAMSVALCIAHAILPKHNWLKSYGFSGYEYPFYGLPERIHVDNAKEFRSKKLSDSCRSYGIELTFRPRGTPHNGAHIERLIGTLMGKIHILPGTTMSSTKAKGEYKSERMASLLFSEFREWLIREVEIYHSTEHSALGCSPLHKWEEYYQNKDGSFSCPLLVDDPKRLLIDFMPSKTRVIGRAGIRMHNIDYYTNTLKRFDIGTKCVVRYDPDSLKKIWILPEGEKNYIELSYADLRLPDTTLSEFKNLRKKIRGESMRRVPAAEIFKLIEKNEQLVRAATMASKQVRKTRERKRSRLSNPGHPLNAQRQIKDRIESVDYSVNPVAYTLED